MSKDYDAGCASGAAVSVCFSARGGDDPCLPRPRPVAVTAAWAGAISDAGRIPLYITSEAVLPDSHLVTF